MLKKWLYRRDPLYDNDVDLITYMNKMLIKEQLSIHDNKVLPLYLYDVNVSEQSSIALWQRRWRNNVYEENESDLAIILPWQPRLRVY